MFPDPCAVAERLLVGGSGSLCCWAVQPALVEPEESDTPSRAPSHDPSSPGQLFSPSTSDLNLRSSPLLLPRGSVSSNKRPAHPEVYKDSEHILGQPQPHSSLCFVVSSFLCGLYRNSRSPVVVDAHAHVEVALWSLTVAGVRDMMMYPTCPQLTWWGCAGLVADICSSASSYYHAIVCELPGRTVVHVVRVVLLDQPEATKFLVDAVCVLHTDLGQRLCIHAERAPAVQQDAVCQRFPPTHVDASTSSERFIAAVVCRCLWYPSWSRWLT